MESQSQDGYFTGKLLLAMPGMMDHRFENAVIFLCSHDENGAMGLVINDCLPGMQFKHLLNELDIASDIIVDPAILRTPLMNGGPVDTGRGFLLHGSDFQHQDTISINSDIYISGTLDALKALSNGNGPQDRLIMFGYAGWDAGQLDEEIQSNAWLVCEPNPGLIFHEDDNTKWEAAIKTLGFDPAMLSGDAGQA
ncbi:MAG: YqgE/AlgH family protein [Bdellovibrionales bacterium]